MRKFGYFPEADAGGSLVFGANGYQFIQGGCKFYKRETLKKILDSNVLDSEIYINNPKFSYQRFMPPYLHAGEVPSSEFIAAEGHILTDIIAKLKLSIIDWEEVYCRCREICPDPKKYAVIHPVK